MLLMGAANASTHDESLNDQPPGTELPGEVPPREDSTANAADEAPQAQVEVTTASALQVNDVLANQLDDPKSADLHEVEVVHPTSRAATTEVESAALAQEEACATAPEQAEPVGRDLGPALAVDATDEANGSPDSGPPEASPIPAPVRVDAESPDSATPPHRVVVLAGRDGGILADEMVSAELLALSVSEWMVNAPDCHIYVDGYLVSDMLRAPVAESDRVPSVEPPHPPKPRLARSLSKKWRR
jgi:hypothetical protein